MSVIFFDFVYNFGDELGCSIMSITTHSKVLSHHISSLVPGSVFKSTKAKASLSL